MREILQAGVCMNTNKCELSGTILSIQDDEINNHIVINLQNIQNDIATLIPIHVPKNTNLKLNMNEDVHVSGYLDLLSGDTSPTLILVATHVSSLEQNNIPAMPEEFQENIPLDESYFDKQSSNQSEASTYILPLEAFTEEDINDKDQGVFITSENRAIDLNDENYKTYLPPFNVDGGDVDFNDLWAMTSRQLLIEVLKRKQDAETKHNMIGIALSKEIADKNIMTHADLKQFFSTFSEIIKIGNRKFNNQNVPYIQVRMSHYSGGQYIFRFISNIFSELPTSPMDWKDFENTFNHLSPSFDKLQKQAKELEDLFKKSESHEDLTTDLSASSNKSISISKAALIKVKGFTRN
jgi:hypothetical protein